MNPLTVYTALIGKNGDRLRQPKWSGHDVRFVCYTDRAIENPGRWELRRVCPGDGIESRRIARFYKLMAHYNLPEAKVTIWHDACMVLRSDPYDLARSVTGERPIAVFKHPNRDCTYDEHHACLKVKKGEPELMQNQVDFMQFAGYPPDNGLAETACVVRRNTEAVNRFNERWWELLCQYSVRDQLSFDFACWELGLKYAHLTGAKLRNPYFVTYPH